MEREGSDAVHRKERGRNPYPLKAGDLKTMTNNFDPKNHLGETQFGKVYRGKMEGRDVTVKMVDKKAKALLYVDLEEDLIIDEVKFLSDTTLDRHPNLVKLIGYCDEKEKEEWGAVYDLNPLDTLYNMILRDEFTWVKRIKVAVGMARLLKFLHGQEEPYVVFNLDPAHIFLDQEYNPILFDFGLLHGGSIGDLNFPKTFAPLPRGYIDRCYHRFDVGFWHYCKGSPWLRETLMLTYGAFGHKGTWCDVYVYGMILLELIAKKTFDKKAATVGYLDIVDSWAKHNYKQKCSLVHDSFEKDAGYDANVSVLITELAMQCIEVNPKDRPTMHQVLERLQVAVATAAAAAIW